MDLDKAVGRSNSAVRLLTLCCLLSKWNTRMDEFANALFLTYIFPNSLLEVSIYGLVVSASAIFSSFQAGNIVDHFPRLSTLVSFICVQRISIAACAMVFLAASASTTSTAKYIMLSLVSFLGTILRGASIGEAISLEKDWIVVVAEHTQLARYNSYIRQIDLICKLAAPIAVSFLVSFTSVPICLYTISAWTVLCLPIELLLVSKIHTLVPVLSIRKVHHIPAHDSEATPLLTPSPQDTISTTWIFDQLVLYVRHPVFLASLSICMLYFTVLSFSSVMMAFLLAASSYTPLTVAFARGASVVTGLLGAAISPFLINRTGLVLTGVVAVWSQALSLIPAVFALWMWNISSDDKSGSDWQAHVFVASVVVSRVGLWLFDLAQTQIMQERVAEDERGVVNGVQVAIQNLFELGSMASTMVFSDPMQFKIPATLSIASVVMAGLTFSIYAINKRS
ncbi:Ferroporti-1 [Cladochytrium replicatum]|nr:Ferroporti-1 [Cladochytrium replicatum]